MRIMYEGGFSNDERRQTRVIIYSNMVVAFNVLLDIMTAEKIVFETERAKVIFNTPIHLCSSSTYECFQSAADFIVKSQSIMACDGPLDIAVCNAMRHLWEDGGVQRAVVKSRELAFHDNLL